MSKLIKKDDIENMAIEWYKNKVKIDKLKIENDKRADQLKAYSLKYNNILVENKCQIIDSKYSSFDSKALKIDYPKIYAKYYSSKPIKRILIHKAK